MQRPQILSSCVPLLRKTLEIMRHQNKSKSKEESVHGIRGADSLPEEEGKKNPQG